MTIPLSVPNAEDLFGAKTKQLARFCEEPVWSAFNPSICYTEEHGYLVLLRSANGFLRDHREEWQAPIGEELNTQDSYETPSEWYANAYINATLGSEKLFRNRMFIAHLNTKTLNLSYLREVDLTEAYRQAPVTLIRGIEDGRLYHDGKTLRISATVFENGVVNVARICSIALEIDEDGTARGVSFDMFDSPKNEDTIEKNWMPVHRTSLYNPDDVKFDYLYESTKTYTIEGRELTDVGGFNLPVRGGSQLIGLENGTMLGIIHQTVSAEYIRFASLTRESLLRRRYVHRFIQYDSDGKILKVSDMFNFLNKSIEFASGISIHENKLLVSFGALDSSAHIASIPLKNVLANLRSPRI
jgi:predicted GH43/DUF377 family glycosyl hydrolase